MSMKKSNIEAYNDSLTRAERIENARKSGIASGKARREGRIMRQTLLDALESEELMEEVCRAVIDKAVAGDISAIKLLRDSIGELPSLAINMGNAGGSVFLTAESQQELDMIHKLEKQMPDVDFTILCLAFDEEQLDEPAEVEAELE